ncbi:MAG: DNA-directed RNA polymerase subunit omega [Chitinophagales bacterium]|nr:DNA-directed RNA polymerase subunit omega [Bacteroidota bacterium]MBX7139792.1 DNA-directed RNA polymerase subunit omega [Chitinophagales bacterium]
MNKNKNNGNNTIVLETRNLADMKERAGNLYEAIAIISKRANQIALQIKEELHGKLEEFATTSDNLEEIHENREQIEISKAYEKMPNPSLLATQEFVEDKIYFRNPSREPLES